MFKMESKQKKSLSETFIELINPAPLSIDPEFDDSETVAKVVENEDSDVDVTERSVSNSLRKRKFDFLEDGDERYDGTKVSRKSVEMDESDIEGTDSEIGQAEETHVESLGETDEESSENNEDGENYPGSEDSDGSGTDNSSAEEDKNEFSVDNDDGFKHISSRNTDLEVEKGIAVRNQLNLWDSLLECRITSQKTLIAANKLPQCKIFEKFISQGDSKFKSKIRQTKRNIAILLEKFVELQTLMLKSYPETKNLGEIQNEMSADSDVEINSDTEEEEEEYQRNDEDEDRKEEKLRIKPRSLKEYANMLSEQHEKYKDYRNATIQKWNEKTRISGGNLSSRNFSNFEQSTLKQIEQVLSNRQRLIQRTQLKRSSYNILGEEIIPQSSQETEESVHPADTNDFKNNHDENKEYNTEIFDDTDFYHQLLRDLIDKKSSDVTDPIKLGRQWLKLQKLRSKMKRKIDTRATKGRKIRYVVHPKLVNFMAPEDRSIWTEEAKTELFNSVFGNKR